MDGSVLSDAGRVICERFLLALKLVPVQSDTLGGEFAEGALDIQEERLSNIARVPTTLQELFRIGECGDSSC